MANSFFHGTPFSVTQLGGGTALAIVSVATNQIPYLTDISIGTDKGYGTAVVYSNGTAIFWGFVSNSSMFDTDFQTALQGIAGTNLFIATTGSTACYINASGFFINNN